MFMFSIFGTSNNNKATKALSSQTDKNRSKHFTFLDSTFVVAFAALSEGASNNSETLQQWPEHVACMVYQWAHIPIPTEILRSTMLGSRNGSGWNGLVYLEGCQDGDWNSAYFITLRELGRKYG